MKKTRITILSILTFLTINLVAQDTITYQGVINGFFSYDQIVFYPNKTFIWTSTYDLEFSKFGTYEISNKEITAKYFNVSSLDELKNNLTKKEEPIKIEKYKIGDGKLFRLSEKGKKIKRITDKSFKTKWSWLLGHKYELIKLKNNP